jgi:hypothetical protein
VINAVKFRKFCCLGQTFRNEFAVMKSALYNYKSSLQKSLDNNESLTKDGYQSIVAFAASICCISQGFLVTQSELMLTSDLFLQNTPSRYTLKVFMDHFMCFFYGGEVLGIVEVVSLSNIET